LGLGLPAAPMEFRVIGRELSELSRHHLDCLA
jgi:hypothetical protein